MKRALLLLIVLSTLLLVACSSKQVVNSSPSPYPAQTDSPSSPTQTAEEPTVYNPPVTDIPVPTVSEKPATSTPIPTKAEVVITATPEPTEEPVAPPVEVTATPTPILDAIKDNIVYEMQRGDNAWFRFTDDGTFYVTGSGRLWDWYDYTTNYSKYKTLCEYIETAKKLIIEEGITHIGYCSILNAGKVEELVLPKSLVYVGEKGLSGCGGNRYPETLTIKGLDKERITFGPHAFYMSGYYDEELSAEPTPIPVTPTPTPIPAPEKADPAKPQIIARGQMGDEVWFEFYDNYDLYIVGKGKTWDRSEYFRWTLPRGEGNDLPALEDDYAQNINNVFIDPGITYLGKNIQLGLGIKNAYIPDGCDAGNSMFYAQNLYVACNGNVARVKNNLTGKYACDTYTAYAVLNAYAKDPADRNDYDNNYLIDYTIEWQD